MRGAPPPVLIARVRRTLRERALVPRGSRVLCACSGGPDSAGMLACLARLAGEQSFVLEAASVDHGLRAEAAEDVAIARSQAERLGLPFHALKIQVAPGSSLQARARELRYAALSELATRIAASRIAVGHTRDDQAETVLARVLRGAGLRGLAGIRPARDDGVVRPLIDCRRLDVHRLARECFTRIANDRSNADPRFERVRIRSHALPLLEAEDRALVRHLTWIADDARACIELVDALADAALARALIDEKSLAISALAKEPAPVRHAALRTWIDRSAGLTPGRAELMQLDLSLRAGRGEIWLEDQWVIRATSDGVLRLCTRADAR
jgi:tRNA(Ile)-lysidine synthase